MKEEITVTVSDAGQWGAKLHTWGAPRQCPGLGGWKTDPDGGLVTWVKGPEAGEILDFAKAAPEGVITLVVEDDRVVDKFI